MRAGVKKAGYRFDIDTAAPTAFVLSGKKYVFPALESIFTPHRDIP